MGGCDLMSLLTVHCQHGRQPPSCVTASTSKRLQRPSLSLLRTTSNCGLFVYHPNFLETYSSTQKSFDALAFGKIYLEDGTDLLVPLRAAG
eukprot:5592560-Prymnesium_polylepis.1